MQCVVNFDNVPIGWLVVLGPNDTLIGQPTFPVVSKRQAELAAGGGVCDIAPYAARPFGATIECRVTGNAITVRVQSDGSLRRT